MFGDIFSSAVSIWNAEQNRDAAAQSQVYSQEFNKEEAEKKRAWDERMSNTQYQRMIQDLNASGLSPMLAYAKGTPSLPSGATASGGGVTGTSGVEAPKLGETSARQAQVDLLKEQVAVAKSQEQLNQSNALKAQAESAMIAQETTNKGEMYDQIKAQTGQLKGLTELHGASATQLNALMDRIRQEINLHKPAEQFKQENPTVSKYMAPVQESLRTIFEGLGLLRGSSAMPFVTKNAPRGK